MNQKCPPTDISILNIDRVGRFSVFSSVSFDINREANAGIDIAVITGSKVIDINNFLEK